MSRGGVEDQKTFYGEGDEWTDPESGAVFKRIDGKWKLIRKPDGTEVRE